MGLLIDDPLNLSRLTRAQLSEDRVDLTALALSVLEDLSQSDPHRKVKFEVANNLIVMGDTGLLRVALQNWIGNAWKFTYGRLEAHIDLGVSAPGLKGEPPTFFIKDNGAGFDMAYSNKLFGAFQRLHAPDEFGGTGIGLATVRRIIHRHNGKIWAEAEVDKGAQFFFTLPAIKTRGTT